MKKGLLILFCIVATAWSITVEEIISIGVGTSKIITLNYVVKSIAIGNPKLLDVVVLGKQEIMLNSKETGITSLTIWDSTNKAYNYKVALSKEASSITLRKYKLNNINFTWTNIKDPDKPAQIETTIMPDTVAAIQKILGTLVDATQATILPFDNAVLIVGTPAEHQSVAKAIAAVDVKEPLTLYEIEVYELTKDNGLSTKLILKAGKDDALDGQNSFASKTLSSDTGAVDPSTLLTFNNNSYTASGMIAAYATQTLKMLQTEGKAKLLATPKLLCLNNKASIITAYEKYPIVSTDKTGEVTVEYLQTGVVLDLVSNATYESDYINCWLNTEVSSITGYTSQGFPRSAGRSMLTSTRIKNNDTLILGGLLKDVESTSISKIPILGDLLGWIPLIGGFFKNESVQKTQTEIVISLKPTLINDK